MLNQRLLLLGALATATACSEAPPAPLDAAPASAASALVGGTQASASAVVRYYANPYWCTGTRVGYRQILTAAHCVHDDSTNAALPSYQPGQPLVVTNDPNASELTSGTTLTIESTQIHPSFIAKCAEDRPLCSTNSTFYMTGSTTAFDVALITTTTDLPAFIPGASIDARPPVMGEAVFKAGYGSEEGFRGSSRTPTPQKVARATTVPSTAYYQPEDTERSTTLETARALAQTHIVTPGQTMALGQASYAPGDSGGPLYQQMADGNIVVFAVSSVSNAGSTSRNPEGISYYDASSRVDASTSYLGQSVYSWLSERGVFHNSTPAPATPDPRLRADIFDWVFYLETNPSLKAAGITTESGAQAHWVSQGIPEGLIAHRNWAPNVYLLANPDVANVYGSTNYAGAVTHYIDFGSYEGRSGRYCYNAPMTRQQALLHRLVFNWVTYLDVNPDLRPAGITTEQAAIDHWLIHGINEGRRASGNFHVQRYRARYPDIDSAFPNDNAGAIEHFPRYGFCEQRFAY